ncbi:MAG TPA: hypothetical protein VF230_06750, partial [Acidimicrobiales bacterium]
MARTRTRRPGVSILAGVLLLMGALGVVATAEAAPGDNPAANLDQCANGKPAAPVPCTGAAWQNGNLNSNNSHYAEGESVPFRLLVTGVTPGVQTSVVIEYDNTDSHKHAYDYLTSFDFTESDANPCTGVTPCVGPTTTAIDTDTTLAAASPPVTQAAGSIAVYNGVANDFAYVSQPAGPEGQHNQTQAEITFTPTNSTVLLAWGGHISSPEDWGAGDAASTLEGSPFHMRLIELDGDTVGNQDRSLKASAVLRHDAGVLAITKSATETSVEHGDTIHYTMLVTYTPGADGSPADNVVVTDPRCAAAPAYQSGDTNTDGLLQGTETWTYTCTYTVASAHAAGEENPISNIAAVNGDDLDGDPLAEATSNEVLVPIVHDAGTLEIVKSADKTSVEHGDTIGYSFTVSYTPAADGAPAASVVVEDDKCTGGVATYVSGDTNTDSLLQGTEEWVFECDYVVPAAHSSGEEDPVVNQAAASAEDVDGDAIGPVDSNEVSIPLVHDEGELSIVKSADKTSVAHGETITYSFAVTYDPGPDGSPAEAVVVTDDKCDGGEADYVSGDTNADDKLQGTEEWVFECEYDVPAAHTAGEENPVVNQAAVEAEDTDGDPIGPEDSNEVSIPLVHAPGTLAVVKAADKTQVAHGGTVTYSFSVTYTPASDGSPAADVALLDEQCSSGPTYVGGDANSDGLLQGAETWTYTCTYAVPAAHADSEEDPILNTATATGKDVDGDVLPTATSNTVRVDLVHAAVLNVDKSVNQASFNPGDTATFTYLVTNTSGDPISNVALTDDKCSGMTFVDGDTNGDGKLQVGETWKYTCSHVVSESGDLTNIATATGVDILG